MSGFDAEGVPHFERAELPGEAPAHGAIDVGDGIGNFGDAARGVETGFGDRAPRGIAGLCRRVGRRLTGAENGVQAARVSSMVRAISSEAKRAFWRGRYSIVAGSSVRISVSPPFLTRW